ncbi:MAG: DUF3108 domain-containing protein [Burkholderiales bacterium]
MFLLKFLISLILFVTAAASTAATPAAASATYNLFRNGTHIGVINENFEIKNGTYTATSETTAIGLFALAQRRPITYSSMGDITKEGLRPARFEGRRNNAVATAVFDWKTDTLSMNYDGQMQTAALPRATQDRLSIMYQLTHLVQSKPRTIEFSMTNARKLDRYRYDVNADVLIDTPLKRLNTLHLVRQREPGDTQTEIWLAPEFHFVPVRVLIIEDDGVRYEQVATRMDVKL